MWSFGNIIHIDKLYTLYPVCEAYHYCICRKMYPHVRIFSAYFISTFLKYSCFIFFFMWAFMLLLSYSMNANDMHISQDLKGKKCKPLWAFWDIPRRKTVACCMKRQLRWRYQHWFYYTVLEIQQKLKRAFGFIFLKEVAIELLKYVVS